MINILGELGWVCDFSQGHEGFTVYRCKFAYKSLPELNRMLAGLDQIEKGD